MAWCRQATSHYLNQCWPIFMVPYSGTRPQWVNDLPDWYCVCQQTLFTLKPYLFQFHTGWNSISLGILLLLWKWVETTLQKWIFNTFMPALNGCKFADRIFKCISLNYNYPFLIKFVLLKIVHEDPIVNKSALVQLMVGFHKVTIWTKFKKYLWHHGLMGSQSIV